MFARSERERAERFGFITFAVAEERPDATVRRVVEFAIQEIAVETRVVESRDRAETHGHRGEFPEVGHESRVGVAGKSASTAADFATEVVEVVGAETAFEKRTCINAGCRVSLEVDVVAGLAVVFPAEEVVEADLVQRRRTGESRKVSADAFGTRIRTNHHDGGVPADARTNTTLEVFVAREPRFLFARNRVDVRRRHRGGEAHLVCARMVEQPRQQIPGAGLALRVDDRIERLHPLLCFDRIDIGKLMDGAVENHAFILAGWWGCSPHVAVSTKMNVKRLTWNFLSTTFPNA